MFDVQQCRFYMITVKIISKIMVIFRIILISKIFKLRLIELIFKVGNSLFVIFTLIKLQGVPIFLPNFKVKLKKNR